MSRGVELSIIAAGDDEDLINMRGTVVYKTTVSALTQGTIDILDPVTGELIDWIYMDPVTGLLTSHSEYIKRLSEEWMEEM